MSRSNLLPDELSVWIRHLPREEFRQRMERSILRRAASLGLLVDTLNLLPSIEALDEKYFTLGEAGNKSGSMEFFRQARMLSALQFVLSGRNEDALYEFMHSLSNVTAAAAIAELMND